MCKLVLKVGDKVRNISKHPPFPGEIGVVAGERDDIYFISYQQKPDEVWRYPKATVHKYLEKIGETLNDKLCKAYIAIANDVRRTTIKKESRNVITGKKKKT